MNKFRITIAVEVDAESGAAASNRVERELLGSLGRQAPGRIGRITITYIPKRSDIVTVVPDRSDSISNQGIRYDIPYRVIKANDSRISHLQEVGGSKRVIAWNRSIKPVESEYRQRLLFRERGVGVGGG